jgi:hypothetical protein
MNHLFGPCNRSTDRHGSGGVPTDQQIQRRGIWRETPAHELEFGQQKKKMRLGQIWLPGEEEEEEEEDQESRRRKRRRRRGRRR